MPLETHKRKIGDHEYLITDLPRKPFSKLLAVVSKAIASSDLFKSGGNVQGFVSAIASLGFDGMESIAEILGEVSKAVDASGKGHPLGTEQQKDLHFSGRYSEYVQWLAFGIEVHLIPLLNALPNRIGGNAAAAASE